MSEGKIIIPEKLFDLEAFKNVCPAKKMALLADFNLEMLIRRHDAIIHVAPDDPYPYDVEIVSDPEYCGEEDNCKIYKILFGAQKNEMIVYVNDEDLISKIVVTADMKNSESIQSWSGIFVVILRNVGLNVPEIKDVNAMIQRNEFNIFHWCSETSRYVFLNFDIKDNVGYAGFFAAV